MNNQNVVVMFPYPSGAGLHLGHYYNYALVDSYCRWLRYKGIEVNQPFGYDAYGLPAENYARQIGGDPADVTFLNIERFRHQMERMNTQYEEKFITCNANYEKWTKWLFMKLYEKGLAYKANGVVNWCPSCETVLANEQVKDEKCDRCDSKVSENTMNQWYFKITDYKDRLIANLDKIDYPEGTIKQQRAWLANLRDWCVSRQRKWGCPIPIEGETDTLDTFVDSSFYFLRYLTDSKDEFLPKGSYRPVDLYVGGAEHACMHLIYARFIHMFLYDLGIVPEEEPFRKVIHQGMITCNGAKMGKSKGNAVNPENYDSDELRMYLMFLGHYFDGGDWSDDKIVGLKRFLNRMKVWLGKAESDLKLPPPVNIPELEKEIDHNVTNFKLNKVVSGLMEFYNKNKGVTLDTASADSIIQILRCFAPGFKLT
jgi:leucyl-tRNA synthetase